MARRELAGLLAIAAIAIGLPALVLAHRYGHLFQPAGMRTIDIVAAAPENGGFQPDVIRVAAGEPIRLRFSVPDVTHGIAIGPGLAIDLGQVEPGHVKELETVFDRAGRYTIYCYTWCSPSHWRMRATIEVYDLSGADVPGPVAEASSEPVIAEMIRQGIDIDAPHTSAAVPPARPSAARGAALASRVDTANPIWDARWRHSNSPGDAYLSLVESVPEISSQQAWDVIAFAWLTDLTAEQQASAAARFAQNCAACHGEVGGGNGPGAEMLRAQGLGKHRSDHEHGADTVVPAFADPESMLGGTTDIYYAKIRRGGMGTGMPSFGPIFTEEETWQLAEHLWTFQFEPAPPGEAAR